MGRHMLFPQVTRDLVRIKRLEHFRLVSDELCTDVQMSTTEAQMFRSDQLQLTFLAILALILGGLIGFPMGMNLHDMGADTIRDFWTARQAIWRSAANEGTLKSSPSTNISWGADGAVLRSRFKGFPRSGGRTGGAHFVIPPNVEAKVAGRNISIEVDISTNRWIAGNQQEFALAYSTAAVGNSGWKKFKLKPGMTVYSFSYKVPKAKTVSRNRYDYLGLISDVTGEGRPIVLHEARFHILE